jgi:hypothetical protein
MTAAIAPSVVAFNQSPFLYINEIKVSNDATTPNTKVDVSAGMCRDSSDVFYMNLGNFNGFLNGSISPNSATVIDATINGVNGLDTGSLAASKVYLVYVIGDPINANPTACILSLALPSVGPLMPTGYSIYRHVGYIMTDGSSHFLLGYNSGNSNARTFLYDAPHATSVTAGTSATYAPINLSTMVPSVNNIPVFFQVNWTANAAADTFNMQGGNQTGDAILLIAGVAGGTAHTVVNDLMVMSQLVTAVPTVNYKVSAVGGVAINVQGFNYYI